MPTYSVIAKKNINFVLGSCSKLVTRQLYITSGTTRMKTSIVLILFLPFLMGCYGLSIQNIIANYIQYTPEPPPHDQPAKLARYVMHYSGKYLLTYIHKLHNYKNNSNLVTKQLMFDRQVKMNAVSHFPPPK